MALFIVIILCNTGYPQQCNKSDTNPSVPVAGVFDQGARFDPNKPVSVPVSAIALLLAP